MARRVRIVGDPDEYEVLCETETTKILVNPTAKQRQEVALLEERVRKAREQLAARSAPPASR